MYVEASLILLLPNPLVGTTTNSTTEIKESFKSIAKCKFPSGAANAPPFPSTHAGNV
jgi:hypothetical protein